MNNNPYQNPYTGLGAIWETQEQLRKQSEANIRQATAKVNKIQAGEKAIAPISQPPPRPMTQEERAEAARQRSNFSIITKKVSVWQHLAAMVISYLDADGALLVDANGDLLKGEAVTGREHLARLKKGYEHVWRERLEYSQARKDQDEQAALLFADATERLALLERGKFICPVNRNGYRFVADLTEKKKSIFGAKIVKIKARHIGISKYDKTLREFLKGVYCGGTYSLNIDGRQAKFFSARTVVNVFLHNPTTKLK